MNNQLLHEQIKKIIEKSKNFDNFWNMYIEETDEVKRAVWEIFDYKVSNELLNKKDYIEEIHQHLHFYDDGHEYNFALRLGSLNMVTYDILKQYSYLNHITIHLYEPSRQILEHIHAIRSLNMLEIYDSPKQTPLNLNQINWKRLDKLRSIHIISNSEIMNFDVLQELTNIKLIKICNLDSVTQKNLSVFKNLTNLKGLILNGLIENKNIDDLKNCSSLLHLDLAYNQIEDISAVESLTQLNVLRLDGNPIKNIDPITKLHCLKRLRLSDCGLTEQQIAYLKESLPNCRIIV